MPHIRLRASGYYFRKIIPVDLRSVFNKQELWTALSYLDIFASDFEAVSNASGLSPPRWLFRLIRLTMRPLFLGGKQPSYPYGFQSELWRGELNKTITQSIQRKRYAKRVE